MTRKGIIHLSIKLTFLRPFIYRDFRAIYFSEVCFFLPAWMAAMAFGLIATHIKGNSPLYVGLIGFGFNLPMLFGPFIGVIVDRIQRITIMKITSITTLIAAIIMGALLIEGLPNYWIMFVLVLVYGFGCAFYYPSILTANNDIIDDANIQANGISLINSTNRIVMFLGYALGGIFITIFSEGFTFWFNAILYILSFIALSFATTSKAEISIKEERAVFKELKVGFKYLQNNKAALAVIIILGITGLLAWPYLFQMPVVNRYYLSGTPATLGLLLAIGGIGGTLGGFLISARKKSIYLTHYFIGSTLLLVISIILFSLSRTVFWAAPTVFLLDFSLLINLTVGIIFVQTVVAKEFQGRIMGIVSMVTFGTIPIGSTLFYGGVGEPFGVMVAFFIAAILILISIIIFWLFIKKIRQSAVSAFLAKNLIADEREVAKI